MGMTIAEKIIAAAAGVDYVKPGDIHTVTLDRMMSNDGTTHLTVDMYRNKLKHPHIADTKKMVFIVDHNVPSDCPKTAASQKKMRDFAKENNIDFWEGKGVCHQVMMENYVCPGELIFGADSHTCSYGALGAFGTGVGCTDLLYGMVTGKSWVLVPETVKFNLVGKLPEGVYARDLILTIIGTIGANGCNYQVMEFTGEGAKTLSISERMVLCNMAVEAGAKTGIFEPDEKAIEYLEAHGRKPKALFTSDPDAVYAREYTFDLSKIRPVVAKPDFVDNLVPAEEVRGVKIDEAFLGSCNNGRIEDLRVGASIIKGKKVAEKVRFLVVPASQTVYLQALKEGLIDIFMEAGAIVMNPNCSVCWGSCQGVIGENPGRGLAPPGDALFLLLFGLRQMEMDVEPMLLGIGGVLLPHRRAGGIFSVDAHIQPDAALIDHVPAFQHFLHFQGLSGLVEVIGRRIKAHGPIA